MMKPEDIHEAFAKALYQKDLQKLAALYTSDAVFHPGAGREPVQGQAAILSELEVFLPVAASMKPVDRTVIVNGDSALIKLVWKMTTESGEEKQFNALEVLTKQNDRWLYTIDNPYGV